MVSFTAVWSLLWALSVEKTGMLGSGGNITKKGEKKPLHLAKSGS